MATLEMIKHSQRSNRKPCRYCGSKEVYWAHVKGGRESRRFCKEHDSANWTLINRDGTLHDCRNTGQADDQSPDDTDAVEHDATPEPAPVTPAAPPASAPAIPLAAPATAPSDPMMQAFQAFMSVIQGQLSATVDAGQVHDIVNAAIADRLRDVIPTVRVEVTRNGETRPVEGFAHKILPVIIKILGTGRHVMMVGPAGTGKSHIAAQAAEALGLESYSISLTPQTPTSHIVGYMTATGDYVGTAFRQAFEHGGVFHFDELDNGHPSTLGVINAALANGHMAFPDGKVKRHPDFRCVASANTYGRGPDRAYVGRQAIDMATLDRFEVVTVDVDEALEEALCAATGLDAVKVSRVLGYVRYLRNKAEEFKLPVSFSPRRSAGACALLETGLDIPQVIEVSIRRGISPSDWSKVSHGAPSIYSGV